MRFFACCAVWTFFFQGAIAQELDCPTCTPEELYREHMALLLEMARDMRELDDTLADMSPAGINVLMGMLNDVSETSVAYQALEIGIKQQEDRRKEAAAINRLSRLAKLENVPTVQVRGTHATERYAQASLPLSKSSAANSLKGESGSDLKMGLWVTFVRLGAEKRPAVVQILADGRAFSLAVGSRFNYNNTAYELVAVENNTIRADNRKFDVFVRRQGSSKLESLVWAVE